MAHEHPAPHGSARFATLAELIDEFSFGPQRDRTGAIVAADSFEFSRGGHLLTVAKTRSGKGTRFLVPALLRNTVYSKRLYDDLDSKAFNQNLPDRVKNSLYSSVVIDPKGENAAMMPGSINVPYLVFNPWHTLGLPSIPINPLDVIDPESNEAHSDAIKIAAMLIPYGKDDKPFFTDRARQLVQTIILHLIYQKPLHRRTIPELYRIIADESRLQEALEIAGTYKPIQNKANDFLGAMRRGSDSWADIIGTANNALSIFDDPAIKKAVSSPPDHVREYYLNLASSWMARRIYVVIKDTRLEDYQPLSRVIIGSLMMMAMRRPGRRVVFYLDEFTKLGYMKIIEEAMTTYTTYNICCWPFIQNLSELKNVYPNTWEGFIANAYITHFFGTSDLTTLKMISEMLGNQTVYTRNESSSQSQSTNRTIGQSRGGSRSHTQGSSRSSTRGGSVGGEITHSFFGGEKHKRGSWGRNWSDTTGTSKSNTKGQSATQSESRSDGTSKQTGQGRSEAGRPLLFPDEIRRLGEGEVLMFAGSLPPAWLKVPAYYERESRFEIKSKYHLDPNPLHETHLIPPRQKWKELSEEKTSDAIARLEKTSREKLLSTARLYLDK